MRRSNGSKANDDACCAGLRAHRPYPHTGHSPGTKGTFRGMGGGAAQRGSTFALCVPAEVRFVSVWCPGPSDEWRQKLNPINEIVRPSLM